MLSWVVVSTALVLLFVLFLCYVTYHRYPTPKIKTLHSVESISPYLESGDLVLVSSIYEGNSRRYTHPWTRMMYGDGEWTHVAIIVKIDSQQYVYDTCPWEPKYGEYDFTSNPHNESGYLHLSKYVNNLNGYVGIRKLKPQYESFRRNIYDITQQHNRRMKFKFNYLGILGAFVAKHHIESVQYNYSCCESVGSIYSHSGIKHDKFFAGMLFGTYIERYSPLFEDVVHIKPGPMCNWSVRKHFDNYISAEI